MSARLDICHLTVLNPARHTRIFHKLARSQAAMGYRVAVMGQDPAPGPYEVEGIVIHPLPPFGRLSWRRLVVVAWLWRRCRALRARAYVLHSPELLPLGWLLWGSGARVIYDVHEDYRLTLRHAAHYPRWLRGPLSRAVRALERLSLPTLSAVSYAEACYQDILGAGAKTYLLRNKYQAVAPAPLPFTGRPYLLYTGTLAPEWGLWDTLSFWEGLPEGLDLDLVIAGYSPRPELVQALRQRIAGSRAPERIHLLGGETYLPYPQIVALIQHCQAGTGFYQRLPQIQGKIPTKFYEYLAAGRPLLYTPDPVWDAFNAETRLGFSWTPGQAIAPLWAQISTWQSMPPAPAHYAWESEVPTLHRLMRQVLGPPGHP